MAYLAAQSSRDPARGALADTSAVRLPSGLVESLPQLLVVGLVLPQVPPGVEIPGIPELTFERLSQLFSELAANHGYRNFLSNPEGTSGQFFGPNVNDRLVVEPGLLQLTDPAQQGVQRAAERADQIIKVTTARLEITNVLQVGVKWVFHVPCPDARRFVFDRLVGIAEEELNDLSRGSGVSAGLRYMTWSDDKAANYSVRVEPLLEDDAFLFVEVDSGFLNLPITEVGATIDNVLSYTQGPVMAHITNLGER